MNWQVLSKAENKYRDAVNQKVKFMCDNADQYGTSLYAREKERLSSIVTKAREHCAGKKPISRWWFEILAKGKRTGNSIA